MRELDVVKWGVFDLSEEDGTVHSAPVVNEQLLTPHTLSVSCPCNPDIEKWKHLFINHNMIQ